MQRCKGSARVCKILSIYTGKDKKCFQISNISTIGKCPMFCEVGIDSVLSPSSHIFIQKINPILRTMPCSAIYRSKSTLVFVGSSIKRYPRKSPKTLSRSIDRPREDKPNERGLVICGAVTTEIGQVKENGASRYSAP